MKHFSIKTLSCLASLILGCWACSSEDNGTPVTPDPVTPEGKTWTPDSAAMYKVAQMSITTEGGKAITSKEKKDAVNCTISIKSDTSAWCISSLEATIRGRGNSSWLWYDKKPYRIKLSEKASILGLDEDKDWVLLANYRDPTDLMNTFVFELGQCLQMPFTNHTRYVELTLNGQYNGLYQLTEQVEQGGGRVDVADDGGVLISLDVDDGPDESPSAKDNFWSSVYDMPVCMKYPDDTSKKSEVQSELAQLENAIKSLDYDKVKTLIDINSFIDFIIIQELVYNVELDAPRSMYMHHDKGGKWYMGPLWDFDGGYDFDWSDMYHSHKYFTSYKELVLGTSPATHSGTNYQVPGFFSDLFKVRAFVIDYQNRWAEVSKLVPDAWTRTNRYATQASAALQRDTDRWPIGYTPSKETDRMKVWLDNRVAYLDKVISNY